MKKTIDATDKKLGRLATETAILLMGKNSPHFRREKASEDQVEIINISKLSVDEKKLASKEYQRYSGYPSGLKKETMGRLVQRRGMEIAVRKAVYGMLPKNKLRSKIIKNLIIKD